MAELQPGAPAPDFEVEGPNGPIRLADYAGKALALYFYPKDDTTGCTREAVDFSALAEDFAAAGAAILGVSKDSLASHAKFAAKHGLAVELGSDPTGACIEVYGAWVEKNMYGRKYMGIERSTFLIDGAGRLVQAWRKVKVPGHAEAVLAAVRGLAG